MTGKSIPCFWELWRGPSYWQKPVSMSKNWEDPFQSGSPGSARGVHIHQTSKPNSWVSEVLSLPSPRVYPQLFRRDDLLDKRKPTEPAREVHAGNQTQTASSFFAGSRFLRTRLWHLSNLQRCLHGSTHGSADTATGYQPSTLAHSPPQKSCFIKTGTMCFAWDKALKMFSHTTSQFNIPLLSLSAFFFGFKKALPLGAHGLCAPGTARSPPHWSLTHCRENTGRQKRGGKREVDLRGRRGRGELGSRSKICL